MVMTKMYEKDPSIPRKFNTKVLYIRTFSRDFFSQKAIEDIGC